MPYVSERSELLRNNTETACVQIKMGGQPPSRQQLNETNSFSQPPSPNPSMIRSPVLPTHYPSSSSVFPLLRPQRWDEVELHAPKSEVQLVEAADAKHSRASLPFQVPRKPLPAYLTSSWYSPKPSAKWGMQGI